MCRSGSEALAGGGTCDPRRCPSSAGERRRKADRLRYRLKQISENLPKPEGETSAPAETPPSSAPSVESIKQSIQKADDAWAELESNPGSSLTRAAYEEAVRDVGRVVHERAVAEYGAPPAEDYDAIHEERFAADQAEYDRLCAIQKDYSDRCQEQGGITNVSEEFKAEWSAVGDQINPISARLSEGRKQMWNEARSRRAAAAEAHRKVLEEVQELGGRLEMYEGSNAKSHLAARAAVQSVADTTPRAWIERSNRAHQNVPLYAYPSKGRAHYQGRANAPIGDTEENLSPAFIHDDPDNPPEWEPIGKSQTWVRDDEYAATYYPNGGMRGEYVWRKKGRARRKKVLAARLTVSGYEESEQQRVARHEFSHRIESLDSRVAVAAREFRERRAAQSDGTKEPLTPIYGDDKSEVGYRDDFVNHYVGKDYGPGPHTEVFSMGSEAVWNGTEGGLEGDGPNMKADPEHRDLILGLYATAK